MLSFPILYSFRRAVVDVVYGNYVQRKHWPATKQQNIVMRLHSVDPEQRERQHKGQQYWGHNQAAGKLSRF